MPTRSSTAQWSGNLAGGNGSMSLGSGAFEGSYSYSSRFESGEGTNPEDLIAAVHAGSFLMALANHLSQDGHEPDSVSTTAEVHLDKDDGGFSITRSDLTTEVKVEDMSDDEFQKHAEEAKEVCPVSRALGAIEIGLEAKLV